MGLCESFKYGSLSTHRLQQASVSCVLTQNLRLIGANNQWIMNQRRKTYRFSICGSFSEAEIENYKKSRSIFTQKRPLTCFPLDITATFISIYGQVVNTGSSSVALWLYQNSMKNDRTLWFVRYFWFQQYTRMVFTFQPTTCFSKYQIVS